MHQTIKECMHHTTTRLCSIRPGSVLLVFLFFLLFQILFLIQRKSWLNYKMPIVLLFLISVNSFIIILSVILIFDLIYFQQLYKMGMRNMCTKKLALAYMHSRVSFYQQAFFAYLASRFHALLHQMELE